MLEEYYLKKFHWLRMVNIINEEYSDLISIETRKVRYEERYWDVEDLISITKDMWLEYPSIEELEWDSYENMYDKNYLYVVI